MKTFCKKRENENYFLLFSQVFEFSVQYAKYNHDVDLESKLV